MMDQKLFLAINGLTGHNRILDWLAIFLGVYLIYLAGALVAYLLFDKRFRAQAYLAAVSAILGRLVIVEIIKQLVNRPRPYELLDAHLLVVDTEKGLSFSSGHTVILFCFAFSFWGTKWFWPLFVAAVLGSVSRIYIGVHYPLDVLASIAIAVLTVLILKQLLYNKGKR